VKFTALYLDVVTGPPEAGTDRYAAPLDGRTCNHIVKADIDGSLVAAWYTIQAFPGNLSDFSLIDVIPYLDARESQTFQSAEAETLYPDQLDKLFILRLSGYPGQEPGIDMTLKIHLLHE
jgi:hypothetical protein